MSYLAKTMNKPYYSTQESINHHAHQDFEIFECCEFFCDEINCVIIEQGDALIVLSKPDGIKRLPRPVTFKGDNRYVVAFNFLRKFLGHLTHKTYAFIPMSKNHDIFVGFTLTDDTIEADEVFYTTDSDGIFEYYGQGQHMRSDLVDILNRVCPIFGLTIYFTPDLAKYLGD